jgi:hypothetical protein
MVKNVLEHLHYLIGQTRPFRRAATPSMHESLHVLMARGTRARSTAELREVIRDARQFVYALGSLAQTGELEQRLRELEVQVKTAAEAAADDAPSNNSDIITLDSLKTKRLLFAIMPFAAEFTDVWIGGIKRSASSAGYYPVRIDMITQTSDITDDIVKAVQLAEVVVIDVTRNNPNVMFEFGYALALKKPYVVISQSTEFLTFDIKNFRSVIYQNSWQGVETLNRELLAFIQGSKAKPKAISGKRVKGARKR